MISKRTLADQLRPFTPLEVLGSTAIVILLGFLSRPIYGAMALLLSICVAIRKSQIRRTFLISLTVAYFAFIAFSKLPTVRLDTDAAEGYYSQLLNQMKSGKLSMPQVPSQQIINNANPYLWANSAQFAPPMDIAYYKKAYYIYWGIGPILTFIWPYHLVTGGHYPTEVFQGFWFACWAAIFFFLAGIRWIETLQKRPMTALQDFLLMFSITFCTLTGAVLPVIDIYQIPIFAALSFSAAALYFVQLNKDWADTLAGFFAGCVFASRPTLAPVMLPVFFLGWCYRTHSWMHSKPLLLRILLGSSPIILSVLLYNYARFENPFDFGYSYTITPHDHLTSPFWDTRSMVVGTWATLFQPYFFTSKFPLLQMDTFGTGWLAFKHRYLNDPNVGIFIAALFALPAIIFQAAQRRKRDDLAFASLYLVAILAILSCAAKGGINLRYTMESANLIVFGATVYLLSTQRLSKIARTAFLCLFWISINSGVLLALIPGRYSLEQASPRTNHYLKSVLSTCSAPGC